MADLNIFNQRITAWSVNRPSPTAYDQDTSHDAISSSSSGSSGTSTSRKRRIVPIVVVVAECIVMLIVTAVLLFSSGRGSDVHRKIDLSLTITSINYTAAYEDPTSDESLKLQSELCNELEVNAVRGLSQQTLVGCDISNLSKGSVIVYFSLFLKMSTKQAVLSNTELKVALGLAPTQEQQVLVTLGRFEISATSVEVLQVSVVNTQDNTIPNKISFNGTCTSNDRCTTSLARCLSNVCACSNDKYYNATTNACLPIDCGVVPVVVNATTSSNSSSFGDHLNITCDNGYEIEANKTHATLTCSRHGSWGEMPRCNPIKCLEFYLPPNTTSLESRVNKTFGDVISYTCQDGFEMTGNESSVKCQTNKIWSQGSECRPVQCVAFDLPPNTASKDILTNRTLGESVSYECVEGFELNGNESTVKCLANKTWTKGSDCLLVKCVELVLLPNSTSNESGANRAFGEVLSYTCQAGF